MASPTVTFRTDPDTLAWLDRLAEVRGCNRTQAIQLCLERVKRSNPLPDPKETRHA